MKLLRIIKRSVPSAILGLILAGSRSASWAAAPIVNNFDAAGDIAGWLVNFGTGAVSWNSNKGPDGSGCLQIVLDGSDAANHEIGPLAQPLPTSFSSADYVTVEYDLMIDPASGADSTGSYGNWQEVLRDGGWSWDSHWVGALGATYNTYQHMKFNVPNNAKTYPMLGFALQGTAPYSGSVTCYVDNLVISPFVNPVIVGSFSNATEVSTWGSFQKATLSFSTLDAGGSASSGSLQMDVAYDSSNTGWQEGDCSFSFGFTPARYTYATFDLYVENPNNLTGLGIAQLFLNTGGWTFVGGVNVTSGMVGKWTHVQMPLPATTTDASGFIFQVGGSMTNSVIYRLDNVTLYKPATPPSMSLAKAGPAGVEITMDDNSSQWQREALCSPSSPGNCFWSGYGSTPVTYSFTIADFPSPTIHAGFEAHMYIVNADTDGGAFNETYGGCDWNASDIAIVSLQAGGGGYDATFLWKTNLPNNNPPTDVLHRPAVLHTTEVLGTWSLSFTENTNITLSGPGGVSTNFTIPEDVVLNNFSPFTSFLQFGFHKNDGANDGHNNQTHGTYSRVQKVGGDFVFDDTFNGPTLTNNYAWRVTKPSAVTHVPQGTAWWLTWTLPADGFTVQSAPAVTGPWGDASVTNTFQRGAIMWGAVPGAALPPGNDAFFRLSRPGP